MTLCNIVKFQSIATYCQYVWFICVHPCRTSLVNVSAEIWNLRLSRRLLESWIWLWVKQSTITMSMAWPHQCGPPACYSASVFSMTIISVPSTWLSVRFWLHKSLCFSGVPLSETWNLNTGSTILNDSPSIRPLDQYPPVGSARASMVQQELPWSTGAFANLSHLRSSVVKGWQAWWLGFTGRLPIRDQHMTCKKWAYVDDTYDSCDVHIWTYKQHVAISATGKLYFCDSYMAIDL